jgi:hypothetical protein
MLACSLLLLMALMQAGKNRQVIGLSLRALSGVSSARLAAPHVQYHLSRSGEASVFNSTSERLIKANHAKGWDAKPLAYVPRARDRVAGLPGEHSTS